jgi:phage-related protein (TIGR01555 family)
MKKKQSKKPNISPDVVKLLTLALSQNAVKTKKKFNNSGIGDLSVPNNFYVPLPVNTNYNTDAITVIQAASQPYIFSNNFWVLNYLYKNEGIVQTFVDLPVDDAFRNGYMVDTADEEFTPKELMKLHDWIEDSGLLKGYINASKWARLFGGGALIISDGEPLDKPFKIDEVQKGQRIEFRDVSLWEMSQYTNPYDNWDGSANIVTSFNTDSKPSNIFSKKESNYFYWQGVKVHKSRALRVDGKTPPPQLRPLLRGWGMSVVEKVIKPLANYYKLNDMMANYIDQSKIDIFKFAGLNEAFETDAGATAVQTKATIAGLLKGINNGLAIDSEDDYIQKQISFTGIPDLKEQIRIDLACSLMFPISKLFGTGSKVWGEADDLENYNSMVESTIRTPEARFNLKELSLIGFRVCFGKTPDSALRIKFPALRVLSPLEEAELKNKQADMLIRFGDRQWLTPKQVMTQANILKLFPNEIDIEEIPEKTPPQPEPLNAKATGDAYGDDSKERNKLIA